MGLHSDLQAKYEERLGLREKFVELCKRNSIEIDLKQASTEEEIRELVEKLMETEGVSKKDVKNAQNIFRLMGAINQEIGNLLDLEY